MLYYNTVLVIVSMQYMFENSHIMYINIMYCVGTYNIHHYITNCNYNFLK